MLKNKGGQYHCKNLSVNQAWAFCFSRFIFKALPKLSVFFQEYLTNHLVIETPVFKS